MHLDAILEVAIGLIMTWLITGLAAAQGSPFWFDLLRKFMGLKSQTAPISPPSGPSQPPAVG